MKAEGLLRASDIIPHVTPLDQQVFYWINRWPDAFSPVLIPLSLGVKLLAIKAFFVVLLLAMLARAGKPRMTAILGLLAVGIANGMTDLFKNYLPFPRPSVDLVDAILRTGSLESPGTASAHSANMAAVATVWVMMLGPRWGTPWIVVALLTGLSRIYVGVHYPAQVLLGWICGIFAGWAVVRLSRLILRQPSDVPLEDGEQPEIA